MTIQQHLQYAQQHIQQWLQAQSIRIYTELERMFFKHVDVYRTEYQWVGVIVVWYCVAALAGWCVGLVLAAVT
jgi:hypothetical protein